MLRLLIILLLICTFANAQRTVIVNQPAITFNVPDVLKKAGVKSVRAIFKDSRGLMWFGTTNGLFRFDGSNLVYRRKYPGAAGTLPDNTIVNIAEDKQGNMWIATLGGIARMNAYNLQCKVYAHTNGLLEGDYDSKVYVDDDGVIWAGNNKGLSVYNADRFKKLKFSEYVTCITGYNDDTLAVGTFKGLFLVDKKTHSALQLKPQYKGSIEPPVSAVYADSRKLLWAGTWGAGLHFYDHVRKELVPFNELNTGIIAGITETTSNGNAFLWANGDAGLVRVPLNSQNNIAVYRHDAAAENSLPAGASGYIYADESGTVWMAGSGEVTRFSPDAPSFAPLNIPLKGVVYEMQPLMLHGKKNYAISSWYNVPGLTILNDDWNVLKQFAKINVSGLSIDKHRRLWVSTLDGLTVLDSNFKLLKDLSAALTRAKTNAVLVHGDSVWVACYKQGLDLFDLNYRKLAHFSENDGSGILENLLWKFYRDSKNNLWICGNTRLYKYPGNGRFTSYNLMPDKIAGCEPRDIAELPNGNLLIASANGLIHFNPQTAAFHYITSPLLQREDNILSVCVDEKGNAWYLTTEHLVHYDLKQQTFTLFDAEDGLRVEKGMQLVRAFEPGTLMIAQDSQVVRFNYAQLEKTIPAPKVLITSLQINDSSRQFSAPPQSLQLKHFQNKLYVEFSGIAYVRPGQHQYAVMLEGVDDDWVISNRNFASYANLGPGKYKLRIKAANYAGNWSSEYILAVNIAPPFWLRWWFIAIAVLIFSSMFYLVVRYISQRNLRERILILEKEQAVEKERSRIAGDMHDDLGSGLTKIAILSEVAKKQLLEPDKAVRQLENISSSSRELVDNLQDIIWVLNPRNDSLESLAAYIREYALKFFEPMDMKLDFQYPQLMPPLKLSEETRRNIFLVMKETFNNIAKHAYGKNIRIGLSVSDRDIEITVQDDGKGFETGCIPAFSNGLGNMSNRMKQIGGQYQLNSLPGKGTVTRLVVPV